MPGPAPKPEDQRRRRNAAPGTVKLPAEGRPGPAPRWPLLGRAPREWDEIWQKPQAVMWEQQRLERTVAEYVSLSVTIRDLRSAGKKTGQVPPGMASLLAERRQQEDRLGLSPMAMKRLQWEVLPPAVGQGDATVTHLDDFRDL